MTLSLDPCEKLSAVSTWATPRAHVCKAIPTEQCCNGNYALPATHSYQLAMDCLHAQTQLPDGTPALDTFQHSTAKHDGQGTRSANRLQRVNATLQATGYVAVQQVFVAASHPASRLTPCQLLHTLSATSFAGACCGVRP